MHTTWEDKSELIEEYDLKTNELLLRKRRKPKPLSGPGTWEYLQGEEAPGFKAPPVALAENSRNVRFDHCCLFCHAGNGSRRSIQTPPTHCLAMCGIDC